MKRVCIFRSNPVNPDSRVEKEASALYEAGFDVTIFCWDRECNHKIEKSYLNDTKIKIFRVGYKAGFGEGIKSLKSYLKFQFSLIIWVITRRKYFDIFHVCDFDTAFFTFLPIKMIGKKVVFDIFDFLGGGSENIFQKILKRAQFFIINHADATIICTEQRMKQIEGSKPRKLIIVHNTPDSKMTTKFEYKIDKSKKSVAYVGILQDFRLLKEMTSYFEVNNNVDFYVGGFGYLESYFENKAKNYDNIHFLGKISYDKTLSLENECDIMTAIYDPTIENHIFAAPNKFYEALYLGKPLLMVKGTGNSEIVEREDIGELIEYSEEGFATGIKRLISRENEWNSMSARMKELYLTQYNWDIMKKRLTELYKTL